MTHSMQELEKRTDTAYEDVSCTRVDISLTEHEAERLRLQIVIGAILLVPVLVGVVMFAPWFTVFGPLFSLGFLASVAVRRLYWLRNVELPRLAQRYRRQLTEATEALQAQEDRRQLKLLKPEEYDRMEEEVDIKRREQAAVEGKRKRAAYEEALWEEAFSRAVKGRNPYSWM